MKIRKFIFSPFQENTYVLWDEESKASIIIDPSCLNENEEDELELFINKNNLDVKYLFNTHGHLDHIFGNAFVKRKFSPVHFAPQKDMPLFDNALEQAESFGITMQASPLPDKYFEEKLKLFIGESEMQFLFTPGHTPGEYCIYLPSEKICFTGDVLFKESIGRTDLWGGNYETLLQSITDKLLSLPEETKIYPGHGDSSTINYEKERNPFLN